MLDQHAVGFLQWMAARPWLMRKEELYQMASSIARGDRRRRADLQNSSTPAARQLRVSQSIAVIPIHGPIMHRGGWLAEYFGLTSIQTLREKIRTALSLDEVQAIVFDVDSPGGEVDGTPELAAEIFALRGQKPMIALVNTLQCSAAHWIGSQADEIIMSPSAQVGSIGVWVLHLDQGDLLEKLGVKPTFIFAGDHKIDGNQFEPLSNDARADLQASVDDVHNDFLAAVARARGTTPAKVRAAYGEGRVYNARQALKLGVVDRIGTLDQVVAKLSARAGSRRAAGAHWLTSALADLPTDPHAIVRNQVAIDHETLDRAMADAGIAATDAAAPVDQAAIDRDFLRLAEAEVDSL
jgi:signal peptide peptidase SppA